MNQARNRPGWCAAIRLLAACLSLGLPARAEPEAIDVGPNTNDAYTAECGSCHFPYQPGLLPARSWRRIMVDLHDHFGDNAEVNVKAREAILAYLVSGAADAARNPRSRAIMESIAPTEVVIRITTMPYIAGVHGGILDPLRGGTPRVESLTKCPVCHTKASEGVFKARRYTVTDEAFRPVGSAAIGR
jgi:mono/diheme cytochrome c family protein